MNEEIKIRKIKEIVETGQKILESLKQDLEEEKKNVRRFQLRLKTIL